jgi:hypothetical protein
MLANVRQTTIRPVIEASVAKGALAHTDEYDVYARLQDRGYGHKTVYPVRKAGRSVTRGLPLGGSAWSAIRHGDIAPRPGHPIAR